MNKLKFIGILLVGIALAFTGCDALQAGLSSSMQDEQATAIGTASAPATWTYGEYFDYDISTLDGNLNVKFSKPVSIVLNDDDEAQDTAVISYSVLLDKATKTTYAGELTLTGAGTLATDKVSYTLPLTDLFAAMGGPTYDGVISCTVKLSGFLSTTEKDPLGAFRAIPTLSQGLTIQPLLSIDSYTAANFMKTGDKSYTVNFPLTSAVSVASLTAFTVSDAEGTEADYGLALSADGKTLTVTLKTTTGAVADTMRDVQVTVPGITIIDTGVAGNTIDLWFTVLPISPAWIPNGKIVVTGATTGGSEATLVQATVNVTNITANDGFSIDIRGTSIWTDVATNVDWGNGPATTVTAGAATWNVFFQPAADGTYSSWRPADAEHKAAIDTGNVTFAITISGTWERVIGSLEDKRISDGNFFLDLASTALGGTVTIGIDCDLAEDL